MAEPEDMILPMLREMRAEIAAFRSEVKDNSETVDRRLKAIEGKQVTLHHALAGDSLYGKLVTGDFQERIEALERKVQELEK